VTPAQAVEYEHEDNYNNVINSVKDKAIKPSPFQNSYAQGQVVRLRIPKGKLDKLINRTGLSRNTLLRLFFNKAKIV